MAKNTLIIVSLIFSALIGGNCTDSSACNYNSSATVDDGSCVYVNSSNPWKQCSYWKQCCF